MKYTKNLITVLFVLLILSFVFFKQSFAITYFNDNFQSGNLDNWTQNVGNVGNTSSWYVLDGVLHSKVTKGKSSFLYANILNIPNSYVFLADAKNISGVDQQYVFRVTDDKKEYYLVDYRYNDSAWSQDNNNIKLYRIYKNYYRLLGIYPSPFIPRSFDITQGINHKIKVVVDVNKIFVFFDNKLAIGASDSDIPLNGTGVGLMTWGGDYGGISENTYSLVQVDGIESLNKNKIIVLPGLGASWNPQAILLNSTAPSNVWTMTPFVKNYNLLIGGLESNGLVRDQDFYVWNYDWRKPLSQIVSDFDDYVSSLNLATGQKIDLVGHSLGGLVARLWTQGNSTLVDHAISLGSPHYGSVAAYEAWNGAKISDNLDVASIGLNILLQIQKKNKDTSVQTLRSYAPIVFDLSPTFSFLKRGGAGVTGRFSQYLATKNTEVSPIFSQLSTLDGIGVNTKEYINLGDRSLFDKVLGIWEDGRPLSYVNGVGDGTVLKKSALILGSENMEFISNHGAIVDKSTNWVLTKLGLGITVNPTIVYPQKQAVFYSDSPAFMRVICGGVEKDETDGFVIMENQDSNNCQISMIGSTSGTYHIVASGNNNWQYFEGPIVENQPVNIVISGVDAYWQMLKQNLLSIGASNAAVAIDQRNIVKAVDEYIKYRSSAKNFRYGEEILENMRYLLNMNTYTAIEINSMYTKALSGKSLVETNLRLMARSGIAPSYSSALNNEQANVLMNYGKNYAANYIAYKLYGIVWK